MKVKNLPPCYPNPLCCFACLFSEVTHLYFAKSYLFIFYTNVIKQSRLLFSFPVNLGELFTSLQTEPPHFFLSASRRTACWASVSALSGWRQPAEGSREGSTPSRVLSNLRSSERSVSFAQQPRHGSNLNVHGQMNG